MNKRSSLAILLSLSIFSAAFGQTPAQTSPQQSPGDDEVVRITTNLVQIDVTVTDKKGNPVTDLTAEDFEITEDGRSQKITNFSLISADVPAAEKPATGKAADKTVAAAVTPPITRISPGEVRRTIALVIDDLCLSWTSMAYVRKALKKFVDSEMQPGDLVAIIRTAGSVGILQQFTSDKRQLYSAIERVRWVPRGCGGVDSFAELNESLELPGIGESPIDRNNRINVPKDPSVMNQRDRSASAGQFRKDVLTVGTLGALSYIVRGLKDLPGRKSVIFISDGFSLVDRESGEVKPVLEAINRVTDLAARSSVVVSTLDARGLAVTNFAASEAISASDITGPSGSGPGAFNKAAAVMTARTGLYNDTKEGLMYLAQQTGGLAIQNTNDLARGIKRVMDSQRSYYLLGYRPDDSTFDRTGRRRFHNFSVKVKRPGVTVRTRKGFYGVPEEAIEAANVPARDQLLVRALISPFSSSGISLRLTSLYGNDPKEGSYMRSLLYIDAKDLTFKQEADGWYQTVMDVMAVTFGDNGQVVDQTNKTQTIRVRGLTYENVLRHGLVYFLNVPVKKAGAYQLRIAVRDAGSEEVGSASQFIEVPDLGKKRLTLSGLVVNGFEPKTAQNVAKPEVSSGASAAISGSEGAQDQFDPQAGAAVRRLRRGMLMNYAYVVYNAQLDKHTRRPQLETQLRLFRDGQLVYSGPVQSLDLNNQSDMARLFAGGSLRLGSDLLPGEYLLQVVVTDLLAKDKNQRTAIQWIDFEIVK